VSLILHGIGEISQWRRRDSVITRCLLYGRPPAPIPLGRLREFAMIRRYRCPELAIGV